MVLLIIVVDNAISSIIVQESEDPHFNASDTINEQHLVFAAQQTIGLSFQPLLSIAHVCVHTLWGYGKRQVHRITHATDGTETQH